MKAAESIAPVNYKPIYASSCLKDLNHHQQLCVNLNHRNCDTLFNFKIIKKKLSCLKRLQKVNLRENR